MQIELSRLVDALPGLVWAMDADGRAELVNDRWREYTGLTSEQLLGEGWRSAVHADDLPLLHDTWAAIRATGDVGEIEVRLRRLDGEYRWFALRLAPFDKRWCGIASCSDEKAASAPDRRLQRFVDNLPTQVIFLTPTAELEYVSREALDFFGKTFEQLKDWATNGVIHPDDLGVTFERVQRTLTEGAPYDSTIRMRRADGAYVWIRARMLPSRDAQGNIVRYCSIQSDVDDLKRADALLSGEVRVLERVARGHPLPEILDALCRLVEEIAGDCFCSAELANGERGAASNGSAPTAQHGLSSCWSVPILSGRDEVLGTFSIYRRTTTQPTVREQELIDRVTKIAGIAIERALSDTALRASEAELRRAHAHLTEGQRLSHTGSFTWDVLADEHTWSEEIYRIFGFVPGARVTMPMIQSAIHPEDMPAVLSLLAAAVQETSFDLVFRIVDTKGAVRHAHVVGHRAEQIPDRPVFLGALRDITDSKVAEEALNKARAELTHVTRIMSLGALTASIAHEVNQPLAGIVTNATTGLHMLAADPPNVDGARMIVQRVLRDGNRAAEVIHRLRQLFARKQTSTGEVNLNEAAREVLALSSSELHRSRVVLRTDLDAALPPVRGDRVQLQQVMLNLLLNAADAMREIDDRPRYLDVETRREGENGVRLTVRDSGVGLNPDAAEKLFDPFYTTKPHGMGIGLSISRSIIESHEGRLWASANEGPGATFAFSIPARNTSSSPLR